MAAPAINGLELPLNCILVAPDGPDPVTATTGTIFRRSNLGGGHFKAKNGTVGPLVEYEKVLFIKEMSTEVTIDGNEYLAMSECAVVGLIP